MERICRVRMGPGWQEVCGSPASFLDVWEPLQGRLVAAFVCAEHKNPASVSIDDLSDDVLKQMLEAAGVEVEFP